MMKSSISIQKFRFFINTVDPNPRNEKYRDLAEYFYNSQIKELFCLEQETFDSASIVKGRWKITQDWEYVLMEICTSVCIYQL